MSLALATRNAGEGKRLLRSTMRDVQPLWRDVDRANIVRSWQTVLGAVVAAVAVAQMRAAVDAEVYVSQALQSQGLDPDGGALVPEGFVGAMPRTGAALEAAYAGVAFHTLDHIKRGASTGVAHAMGTRELLRLTQVAISDTARSAASVAITSKNQAYGWTRVLTPPSCPRCVVLAGQFYEWNQGFQRHPNCDCRHLPSATAAGGAGTDPYEYFFSLSDEEQARAFGKASAQAIRDGGDIFQVVNERMSRTPSGKFTSAGTSKRGYFRTSTEAGQAGKRRLTVDEIYRRSDTDRDRAKRMLEEYGYITGAGQAPQGAIRGPVLGYGQFGRGGARAGAAAAVREARRTGVRDPNSRYTMTAEELRQYKQRSAQRYS